MIGHAGGQIAVERRHGRLKTERIPENERIIQGTSNGYRLSDLLPRLRIRGVLVEERAGQHQPRPCLRLAVPHLHGQFDGGPGVGDGGCSLASLHAEACGDEQQPGLEVIVETIADCDECLGVSIRVEPMITLPRQYPAVCVQGGSQLDAIRAQCPIGRRTKIWPVMRERVDRLSLPCPTHQWISRDDHGFVMLGMSKPCRFLIAGRGESFRRELPHSGAPCSSGLPSRPRSCSERRAFPGRGRHRGRHRRPPPPPLRASTHSRRRPDDGAGSDQAQREVRDSIRWWP